MKSEYYADWIVANGGEPDLLTANGSLDGISGLLLTGGEDVDPALYGEVNRHCRRVNPDRDRIELELLESALKQHLPVLAVCRGMQLLAVALGGRLYQDLSEHIPDGVAHPTVFHRGSGSTDTTHPIDIKVDSQLMKYVGQKSLAVNSHHHQGIRTVPYLLRASAHSEDGLVEAVEGTDKRWILGMQWHPEKWPGESSRAIMRGFLAACDVRASNRKNRNHAKMSLSTL